MSPEKTLLAIVFSKDSFHKVKTTLFLNLYYLKKFYFFYPKCLKSPVYTSIIVAFLKSCLSPKNGMIIKAIDLTISKIDKYRTVLPLLPSFHIYLQCLFFFFVGDLEED